MAFDKDDTKRALKDIFDQAKKQKKHSPARPRSMVPERLPNNARIFLVSDFGTGLYGAPVINKTVLAGEPFDLLLHLGDIYYSGTEEEVGERFLRHWPMAAGHVSRTLNGNHDMYSGGYGYFDVALPAFRQESSYFALQNDNWLLIGLDTAYKDNSIGRKQRHWIDRIVDEAGDRRLILFSHHPLFSNFKEAGEKLAKGLEHLLVSRRIDAWYWGHEHHCVIYDRHPIFGLRGRCLGNGGMPSKRSKLNSFAVERSLGNIQWRRGPNVVTPRSLYLDGPNHFIPENPSEYGPHGYMTLSLRSNRVTEQVHLAGGEVVFEGTY
ncbi:Calcineurin-like phosphoesterase [Planctomyces sp. SH-PL14]|nr:Calcineurin-like phosphoesterase [Planctomyces sp. SH-PL14]